jgi:hypothetical protein
MLRFCQSEFAMNTVLVFLKNSSHACAIALLVATILTACGGDNPGPTGSAVDNSALHDFAIHIKY